MLDLLRRRRRIRPLRRTSRVPRPWPPPTPGPVNLGELPAPPQERRRRHRQCRERGGGGGLASLLHGGGEGEAIFFGEPEGVREGTDGVGVRPLPLATLEGAYGLGGEPRPGGELLLRQPRARPEGAQPLAERGLWCRPLASVAAHAHGAAFNGCGRRPGRPSRVARWDAARAPHGAPGRTRRPPLLSSTAPRPTLSPTSVRRGSRARRPAAGR